MRLTATDVAARLDNLGVRHDLLRAKEETPTVQAAADALGIGVDDIVKSVLFADKSDSSRFVLVLARGLSRVDRAKLAAVVEGRWRLASAQEVLAVTGFEAGTVAPVVHATPVLVVMDARVAEMEEMVAGGGEHDLMIRIARADVVRLTSCTVGDVC